MLHGAKLLIAMNFLQKEEIVMIIHSKRILVVDDEEISQTALQLLLRSLGHEVTVASNGEEAIELFQKTPFPFVIMDFNMPGMGGLEAVKAIRQLEKERKSFIMGLTANHEFYRSAGLMAGMNVVYNKPITLNIIEQAFGITKSTRLFNE